MTQIDATKIAGHAVVGPADDAISATKAQVQAVVGPADDAISATKLSAHAILVPPRRRRMVFPMRF